MKNRNELPIDLPASGEEAAEIPIIGELDKSLGDGARQALLGVDQIDRAAEAIAQEHPELSGRAISLRERARKLGKQIAKTAEYMALLASLVLAADIVDHKLTRYHVNETTNDRGEIVFNHQDQETTDVLNYLSGKGNLPEKDKLKFGIARLKKAASNTHSAIPENIERMNEDQLSKSWDVLERGLYEKYGFRGKYTDGELKRETPDRYQYSKELYQALWRIEKEAGNPRIRFEDCSQPNPLVAFMKVSLDTPHYDPLTNTVYIDYPRPNDEARDGLPDADIEEIEDFVAEASHGKQWEEKPLSHDFRGIRDTVSVIAHALRNARPFNEAYGETQYEKPGTVEYEAHKQIEPELTKELASYKEAQELAKKNRPPQHDAHGYEYEP